MANLSRGFVFRPPIDNYIATVRQPGESLGTVCGLAIPGHIRYVVDLYDPIAGDLVIKWLTDAGNTHEMRVEGTDSLSYDNLVAILAAMRMSD